MNTSTNEFRIYSPSAKVGQHFPAASLEEAMRRQPHVLGCDAGSTDLGPLNLGSGTPYLPRDACKRDLELLLLAARKAKIPLMIGSSGWSGSDAGLAMFRDIVLEVARAHDLHFRLALIRSEQDRQYLKEKLHQGRITPLRPWTRELDEGTIDRSSHIVGCMGVEPFMRALDAGADVILAGRSTDPAIFAAGPLGAGFSEGLSWHAGKVLECAASCAKPQTPTDGILVTIRRDDFLIEPMNGHLGISPRTVATQALHETSNPVLLPEPSGDLDTANASYEQFTPRSVRVTGSIMRPRSPYTIKLEGAELVGFRTVDVAGIRDPLLIDQIEDVVARAKRHTDEKIHDFYRGDLAPDDYKVAYHFYGRDGVMKDREPNSAKAHELGIVIEVVAPTQAMADTIAVTLHMNINHDEFPGRLTQMGGNVATPFQSIPAGETYRFNMCHVVEPGDPYEMFPMDMVDI